MDTWRIFVNPYVCVKFRYQQYEFIFIFQYVKKKYLKKKKKKKKLIISKMVWLTLQKNRKIIHAKIFELTTMIIMQIKINLDFEVKVSTTYLTQVMH